MPEEAREDLPAWTRHFLSAPSDQRRAGPPALNGYRRDLLAAGRRAPSDDPRSRSIAIRGEDSGRLSGTALLGAAVVLVVAGHETTVSSWATPWSPCSTDRTRRAPCGRTRGTSPARSRSCCAAARPWR
ncbi:hypothetical protein GCM10010421_23480 [Streptomyces glaucus]|uniref:Uncharacterized protein n=1 Tax=Streptomyces glaucus TaxID=284029 RepID=A0ABP5WR26_9ACTN